MTMMNILASNARMALLHSTRGTVPSMRSDLFAISAQLNFNPVSQKHHTPAPSARLVSHFTVQPQLDAARFPVPTGGFVEQVSPAIIDRTGRLHVGGRTMRASLRRMSFAAAAVIAIAGGTTALPSTAQARGWHHGWHGGGWGWGPGFAFGFGGPYYGGPYAYAGDCVMRRRWVINRWGHRAFRWVRVCY